eukprot:3033125-Amphidinium_carterae.2
MSFYPAGQPYIICTDGACEGANFSDVTVGGILFVPDGVPSYFYAEVPPDLVQEWQSEGKQQTIFQAELLPVLLAFSLWQSRLAGKFVLVFVDNEAARMSLISSSTTSRASLRILVACNGIVAKSMLKPWFARVPTHSNPADAASRGLCSQVEERWGASRIPVPDVRSILSLDLC